MKEEGGERGRHLLLVLHPTSPVWTQGVEHYPDRWCLAHTHTGEGVEGGGRGNAMRVFVV